jgi:hypothetical protein
MEEHKVISIETKKCCYCGKTLHHKSEQFGLNEKQVVCSACWDRLQVNPMGKCVTQPILSLVLFPGKLFRQRTSSVPTFSSDQESNSHGNWLSRPLGQSTQGKQECYLPPRNPADFGPYQGTLRERPV